MRKIFYLCILLTSLGNLKAQVYDYETINQYKDFPSSTIFSIIQDSRDLIWIGTDGAGLVRYNGNNFRVIHKSEDKSGFFITDLAEDTNKNIVAATKYSGLFVYNGSTFIQNYTPKNSVITSNIIQKLYAAKEGVYCFTNKEVVLLKKDYSLQKTGAFKEENYVFNSVFRDKFGTFYLGTDQGLLKVNGTHYSLVNPELLKGYTTIVKISDDSAMIGNSNGALWELKTLDRNNSETKLTDKVFQQDGKPFSVKKMFVGRNGFVWIAGDKDQGLIKYSSRYYSHINKNNGFLGENVQCLFQDKVGRLYLGTYGTGIFRTGQQMFYNYSNIKELDSPYIFSILTTKTGLYVGILNRGVFHFESADTAEFALKKSYLNGIGASVLVETQKGNILAGTKEGLFTVTEKQLIAAPVNNQVTEKTSYRAITELPGHGFLAGTNKGLFLLDTALNKVQTVTENTLKEGFQSVTSIEQFEPHIFYIGTEKGIFKAVIDSKNRLEVREKITSAAINASCKDTFGNIWFSSYEGLFCLNKNQLLKYTPKNGLTSSLIFTLTADLKGNIYAGSNLGIDKIKTNHYGKLVDVKNFNSKNGFLGLETNTRAETVDKNGDIYFGTVKGLYKYLSSYRQPNYLQNTATLQITNIDVFDKKRNWAKENLASNYWFNVPKAGHVFQSNENQLTFQFTTINALRQAENLYSYYLEGIDKTWSEGKHENKISYSNLRHGHYTFHVRLVDIHGKQIGDAVKFPFQIETPFYYKWWFLLPIFILIGIFIKLAIDKASTYNKDFIRNFSESNDNSEEIRTYFFFLGIIFPLTEIINLFFIQRSSFDLIYNLAIGVFCFLVHYLSQKDGFIRRKLPFFFTFLIVVYAVLVTYKIATQPFDMITFTEFLLILFFSYSVFKKVANYLIFVVSLLLVLIILLFNIPAETKQIITLINTAFIILVINYARRISILNSNDKIMFSNSIINNSNSITIATDRQGNLTFCGKSIEKILGYTPEEVMGKNFWKLTDDKDFTAGDYNEIYVPDSVYTRKLRCKNGEYKYIQWTDQKYSDNLFVANGQDITPKILVEEQYRNLVQFASDIIFETDKYGYFIFVNQFAEKSLGYKVEDLIGKHFTQLVKSDYVEKVAEYYINQNNNRNDFEILEFPILKSDGEEMWVSQKVTVKKDENGNVKGFSSIVRDITALKNIEKEEAARLDNAQKLNKVINELYTINFLKFNNQEQLVKHIIKKAATAMDVSRSGLWLKKNDQLVLKCLYKKEDNSYISGTLLHKKDYPLYFNAIENKPFVVASDANNNPDTSEFRELYFKENNIKSLLDFPIYISGELQGVTCYENIGEIKHWTPDEINFARTVSDIIALAIETMKRKKAEELIIYKSEILTAIAKTTDKLLQSDHLEDVFEESLKEVGKSTKVDRIYYFENDPTTHMMSQKFEWTSSESLKEIDNPELQNIPHEAYPDFITTIMHNKPYISIVEDIPEGNFKTILKEQQILSILILPIFVKDVFNGFIGFDDCTTARIWTTDEINILQTFTNNIAATIERIHSEKIIRESEEKFRLLANNIPATVYLVKYNSERTKVFLNDEIEKLTGYAKDDFMDGKVSLIDLYHPEEREAITREIEKAINKGKPFHVSYRLVQKNGNIIWAEEYGETISMGEENSYIEGVVIDITERKQIEEALKGREIAEAANKAKTQFLANMSHEIRTPLNGIVGFTNLLLKSELTPIQEQYTVTVNQSADALLEIVNDILDLSKIEAGKLELDITKANLHDIVNQVIDMIKYSAHEKQLDLIVNIREDIPCLIWVDEIRMKQILMNLLSNAVKFTQEGEIELEVQYEEINQDKSRMRFLIKDTGIGIKPENRERIFEAFSQEDNSTTRKYGGTGLGIPITDNLLQLMNSKLKIKDRPEGGTIFYFDLEFKAAHCGSLKKIENNHIRSILIIEDNISNTAVLERMLNHFEIKSVVNKNYQNAYIFNPEIDAFVADYELIGKNGLDDLSKFRKPIILMQNSNAGQIQYPANAIIKPIVKPVKIHLLQLALGELNNPTHPNVEIAEQEPPKNIINKALKVLIVEDNKINMLLSKTLVEKILPKAEIFEAGNGEEAIQQYDRQHPDLILMDIQMPVMNGYEATLNIREKDKECIIIALTAGIIKDDEEYCKKIGMNDYIAKPINKESLEKCLLFWIKSS